MCPTGVKYSVIEEIRRNRGGEEELLLWINPDYNSGSAACDTTNSSTMEKHREGGKKERKQHITRRDRSRGGTSAGGGGGDQRKNLIIPQLWKRKHTGGHRPAWLTNIYDETQKSTSIKRFSSLSTNAVSCYSPRPLEALRPPSHPAPGTQIKPSVKWDNFFKKGILLK